MVGSQEVPQSTADSAQLELRLVVEQLEELELVVAPQALGKQARFTTLKVFAQGQIRELPVANFADAEEQLIAVSAAVEQQEL